MVRPGWQRAACSMGFRPRSIARVTTIWRTAGAVRARSEVAGTKRSRAGQPTSARQGQGHRYGQPSDHRLSPSASLRRSCSAPGLSWETKRARAASCPCRARRAHTWDRALSVLYATVGIAAHLPHTVDDTLLVPTGHDRRHRRPDRTQAEFGPHPSGRERAPAACCAVMTAASSSSAGRLSSRASAMGTLLTPSSSTVV